MRNIGPVIRSPDLYTIYRAVTSGTPDEILTVGTQKVQLRKYHHSGCRYIRINHLLYVEQNPNKNSEYAQRARQGEKIMWVINRNTNEYLGRVDQGTVWMR